MKLLQLLLIPLFLSFGIIPQKEASKTCINSDHILEQSKLNHDPNSMWEKSHFAFHIQEPRIQNPERYSKIVLNNLQNSFSIERNREEGRINRIIDQNGSFRALLNESENIPDEIIEKYGLNKGRSAGYWNFYKIMYGLPMSINENVYKSLDEAELVQYEEKEAFKINIELKEQMISKYWSLIISTRDYELLAIEINSPENENSGELIDLDGTILANGVKIPRMRHWYDQASKKYLGSDIIVKELDIKE